MTSPDQIDSTHGVRGDILDFPGGLGSGLSSATLDFGDEVGFVELLGIGHCGALIGGGGDDDATKFVGSSPVGLVDDSDGVRVSGGRGDAPPRTRRRASFSEADGAAGPSAGPKKSRTNRCRRAVIDKYLRSIGMICSNSATSSSSWSPHLLYDVLMDSMMLRSQKAGSLIPKDDAKRLLVRISTGLCERIESDGFARTTSVNLAMRIMLVTLETMCDAGGAGDLVTDEVVDALYRFASVLCVPQRPRHHDEQDDDDDEFGDFYNSVESDGIAGGDRSSADSGIALVEEMSQILGIIDAPRHVVVAVANAAIHFALHADFVSSTNALIRVLNKYRYIQIDVITQFLDDVFSFDSPDQSPPPTATAATSTKANRARLFKQDRSGYVPVPVGSLTRRPLNPVSGLLMVLIQARATERIERFEQAIDPRIGGQQDALRLVAAYVCTKALSAHGNHEMTEMIELLVKDISQMMFNPCFPVADLFANSLCHTLLFFCNERPIENASKIFCINLVKVLLSKEVRHLRPELLPGQLGSAPRSIVFKAHYEFGSCFALSLSLVFEHIWHNNNKLNDENDSGDRGCDLVQEVYGKMREMSGVGSYSTIPLFHLIAFRSFCERYRPFLKASAELIADDFPRESVIRVHKAIDMASVAKLLKRLKDRASIESGVRRLRAIFSDSVSDLKLAAVKCIFEVISSDVSMLENFDCKKVVVDGFECSLASVREASVALFGGLWRDSAFPELYSPYWPILCTHLMDPSSGVRLRTSIAVAGALRNAGKAAACALVPADILARVVGSLSDDEEYSVGRRDKHQFFALAVCVARHSWFGHSSPDDDDQVFRNMVVTVSYLSVPQLAIVNQAISEALPSEKGPRDHVIRAHLQRCCSVSEAAGESEVLIQIWLVSVIAAIRADLVTTHLEQLKQIIDLYSAQTSDLSNQIIVCALSSIRLVMLDDKQSGSQQQQQPDTFLSKLMNLVLKKSVAVMELSIACLSLCLTDRATIAGIVEKLFNLVIGPEDPDRFSTIDQSCLFNRSICVLSLLMKFFDLSWLFNSRNETRQQNQAQNKPSFTPSDLLDLMMNVVNNSEIDMLSRIRCLQSIGFMCDRKEYLCSFKTTTTILYSNIIESGQSSLITQAIDNINRSLRLATNSTSSTSLPLAPITISQNPDSGTTVVIDHSNRSGVPRRTREVDGRFSNENVQIIIMCQLEPKKVLKTYETNCVEQRIACIDYLSKLTQCSLIHPEEFPHILLAATTDRNDHIRLTAAQALVTCFRTRNPSFLVGSVKRAVLTCARLAALNDDDVIYGNFSFLMRIVSTKRQQTNKAFRAQFLARVFDGLNDPDCSLVAQAVCATSLVAALIGGSPAADVTSNDSKTAVDILSELLDRYSVESVQIAGPGELLEELASSGARVHASELLRDKKEGSAERTLLACVRLGLLLDTVAALGSLAESAPSQQQDPLLQSPLFRHLMTTTSRSGCQLHPDLDHYRSLKLIDAHVVHPYVQRINEAANFARLPDSDNAV